MIDIKLLLNDPKNTIDKLLIRNIDRSKISLLTSFANDYKVLSKELEDTRAYQNSNSKLLSQYKNEGRDITSLRDELSLSKLNIAKLEEKIENIYVNLNNILLEIPNILDSNTPIGKDERDNVVLKYILEPKKFDFKPKEHWELAQENKWIDFEAGVKLSKSRFSVLRGMASRLNRALINFMLDHNREFGFEEVSTPVIVNEDSMLATGQLPKFEDDMFKISNFVDTSVELPKGHHRKGHNLYLISTSEITLTNLYRNCIIKMEELPIKLSAYTPCFRKEAGSAGKDTRGMIRQHQFDKVELVAITHPDSSDEMQKLMLSCASSMLEKLGLAHRYVQLCSGDIGFSASNTIDIEVWLPGQGCYREISSISNVRDFQARRGKIRFKDGKKNVLVHTLNGSSLAVGRTLIAIMENYQNKDGSITIPPSLEKYMV